MIVRGIFVRWDSYFIFASYWSKLTTHDNIVQTKDIRNQDSLRVNTRLYEHFVAKKIRPVNE